MAKPSIQTIVVDCRHLLAQRNGIQTAYTRRLGKWPNQSAKLKAQTQMQESLDDASKLHHDWEADFGVEPVTVTKVQQALSDAGISLQLQIPCSIAVKLCVKCVTPRLLLQVCRTLLVH